MDMPKGLKFESSLFLGHACIILGVVKPNKIFYDGVWFGLVLYAMILLSIVWHGMACIILGVERPDEGRQGVTGRAPLAASPSSSSCSPLPLLATRQFSCIHTHTKVQTYRNTEILIYIWKHTTCAP